MEFLSSDDNVSLASQIEIDRPKGLVKFRKVSLAEFRTINGKVGRGRFVVSEGVGPSCGAAQVLGVNSETVNRLYAEVHRLDYENFLLRQPTSSTAANFEIVIPKGTYTAGTLSQPS